jgi:sugar phosphate isomerase/epimerase
LQERIPRAAPSAPKLSLAHLTLIELTPPQVVETAAAAGFTSVNLRLAPVAPGEAQHPMIGNTPMKRETLARMRDLGVGVHDVEIVRLLPDSRVAAYEALLECAGELGARYMLVAGDSPDEGAIAERFAQLCELGRPYGVSMGLEFMPWTGIKDLHSARRVVAAAGQGGVIIDAMHLDRSGGSAADIGTLPASMQTYFQICDAPAERPTDDQGLVFQARRARLPPGAGGLDLVAMVTAIPEGSTISIEVPMHGLDGLLEPLPRARMLKQATEAVLARAAALKSGVDSPLV